ncbi:MAG: hypothetical protein BWY65_02276 [Firmicutes bacterium ADurb.Bin373]|nr:MAG: hypothetical protein BWY65_02276 [Firmicutes bacterium ADurb.Bin373]
MVWTRSSVISTFIAGISLIIAVALAINGFVGYKQNAGGGISATGSATRDFSSDLIVWRGNFSAYGQSTTAAYEIIKRDAGIIEEYLVSHNVPKESIVFSSVSINPNYRQIFDNHGNNVGSELVGYYLNQGLTIQSTDVDSIEIISRGITELIGTGVNFTSEAPEYYYTKLGELKLELIDAATADAKARIDIMAEQAGGKVDKLLGANLGTFQITAQNSATDSYIAGGAFNTWSREKTMFISVELHYALK